MTSGRSTWTGTSRLLIDGNNLLHRISGSVDDGAQRRLLAQLRGMVPAEVRATLMFDGHAASGTDRRQRIAANIDVQHSGSLTADEALLNIVKDTSGHERAATVLVTDDRALTDRARALGARTQRLAWLEGVLSAPPARPGGIGTNPRRPMPTPQQEGEDGRKPWRPGRGATAKRGNPRRGHG